MNVYAIPNLISGIFSFSTGFFSYFKNRKSPVNQTFFLLTITVSYWQFGTFLVLTSFHPDVALSWCRFVYIGATFIPVVFYHFTQVFLKKWSKFILFNYLVGFLIFLPLSRTSYFISGVYEYFWGYWFKAGIFHLIFLIYFIILMLLSLYDLLKYYKKERVASERLRQKYLFAAFLIAYLGAVDYIPNYGIRLYPFGHVSIIICALIIAYAILRYRLMDITVAITRTGIFVAVYTLVLGVPFALANWLKAWLINLFGNNWWIAPLGLMAVLATVGPFIYIYLQRKTEDRLLKEQRRYQEFLKEAAIGMTRIRDLKKLLNLIVHILTKTVRISHSAIYLYDSDSEQFILQVSRNFKRPQLTSISKKTSLMVWLQNHREPLVYEEIKRRAQDNPNLILLKEMEEQMRLLNATVLVPSLLEDRFIGFLILGDKRSGQIYTTEDLDLFSVLASQAALAIENALFIQEAKVMQEQIAQAEKMATIGTMADGLSHQINNRLNALSLIAEDTLDTIKTADISQCSAEVKKFIDQINYALERIQANALQGGEVVKGLLKYSRKGGEGLEALDLNTILDNTLEMVQYKVKLSEIDIIRNFPNSLPRVEGNLAQLEEVFFNFIDNAYDAILERRNLLKEEGYRGRITISAYPKDSVLEIIIEDNGIGMKEDERKRVFTPFFTTKISSRKGTGLGLYVIKRIITETHKGKINFESEYKTGSRFIVELPIAK